LDQHENIKKELWKRGYEKFLEESTDWPEREVIKWKEHIDDDIRAAGYDPVEILSGDFRVPVQARPIVGKRLPLLKIYSAPVSFGPMGHSLSVITRNIFHEYGIFNGYSDAVADDLRKATKSASQRYLREMAVVEDFLAEHGCGGSTKELQKEREMISYMSSPASSAEDVQRKAETILDEFVPRFVNNRLTRLYSLVEKLRAGSILPDVIQKADTAIRRAYEALGSRKSSRDAAQDAIMILATHNWKPKPVPEYLPLIHYQTVARIRNKVLKLLNGAELFVFKHQQSILDLEAFLIITPLLYQSGVSSGVF
jgi:hypothetical protein